MSRFGLLRSPLRALRAAGAAAHAEIAGVVAGIGLFADLRDWPRLERLLAPQVELDYTSLFGGQPAALERAALLAQWQALLPGFDATQHLVTNIHVEGAGAVATATSHVRATHWIGTESWTVGGIYTHRLERGADGWRVTRMRLQRLYEEGDRGLVERAARRAAAAR